MLLEVKDMTKSYTSTIKLWQKERSKAAVIKNISFHLESHEIIGLVGKSGCGKSTIARLIVDLEKPDEGSVKWNGINIATFNKKEMRGFRKDCQLIHQDSLSSFNPSLTMQASLMEPLKNHFHYTNKECLEYIKSILSSMDLSLNLLDKRPHELSGGQRQRFNIIRALLVQPRLLICDEITAGLDKIAEANIIHLLKNIHEKTDMTVLFISHDLRLVQHFCKRIIVIENNAIVECAEKINNQFFFSHPHSTLLFQSLPISHPENRYKHP